MQSPKSPFTKISLWVALVLGLTAVTTWQVSRTLESDRASATLQSLAREAAPFQRLIQVRASSLRDELATLASRKDNGGSFESDAFDAMAWVEKNNVKWAQNGRGNFDASWLRGVNFEKLPDGEAYFVKRSESDGSSRFALLMSAKVEGKFANSEDNKIYLVGVLNSNAMAGLVDDWVGSSRTAAIFDDKGYALADTSRRLVGTSLKSDALVKAALAAKRNLISAKFEDIDGRNSVGHTEAVAQTNLHLALSVSNHWISESVSKTVQATFWISLLLFSLAGFGLRKLLPLLTQKESDETLPKTATPAVASPGARTPGQMATAPASHEWATNSSVASAVANSNSEPASLPDLDFEMIEQKAKLNVKEILDKSAEIRARLNLDFVEDFTSENVSEHIPESKASAPTHEAAGELDGGNLPNVGEKLKIRRPKVQS